MVFLINCHRGQSHSGVKLSKKYVSELFPKDTYIREDRLSYKNLRNDLFKMAEHCIDYSKSRDLSIFVGGDHLSAYATVMSSLIKYGNNFKLVWIDAHADIHSFESSPSWNLHGMVVRLLMTHNVTGVPKLLPSQLYYIGLRSVEEAEWSFIHEQDIKYISAEMLFSNNRNKYLKDFKKFIKNQVVHLSLDVDAFDSGIVSNTGTPESGGLQVSDFKSILEIIRYNSSNVAVDIMEINPELGDNDKGVEVLKDIIHFITKIR
jgi:arginase